MKQKQVRPGAADNPTSAVLHESLGDPRIPPLGTCQDLFQTIQVFEAREHRIFTQRGATEDHLDTLFPPSLGVIRPGMECENAERPRILGRAIATATVTAGQDDLYHPDSFAPDEPPTFAPQQFRLRTGDPEALGPPCETIEVPAPETGCTPAYGKGLEQSVAILETAVGNAQAVGLDPIDQHSQRQYRKPRTDLYQTRCARVYSRPKMSVPSVPLKPKELVRTTSIFISQVLSGT